METIQVLPEDALPIQHSLKYFITPRGEVINSGGRTLSSYSARGYSNIKLKLSHVDIKRTYLIHRLVYETFVGPIPKGYWINHKDGIKSNNNLENLEADTPSHNHLHASRVLKRNYLRGEDSPFSKLSNEAVELIRELYKEGRYSQYKLAEAFQVSQAAISNIVNHNSFKHMQEL